MWQLNMALFLTIAMGSFGWGIYRALTFEKKKRG